MMFKTLNRVYSYFISLVIAMNLVLLILLTPASDHNSESATIVRYLDAACTIIFIIEALLKILASGFIWTSLDKHYSYLSSFPNIIELLVIVSAVSDFFIVLPKFDGVLNSLKCLRTFQLLKLLKKNDLMDIIIKTI